MEQKMNPLISLIMGVYNCQDTLEESIDSVLNQTYTNWELIICDDASTDQTYKILKKYEELYGNKIMVISNDKNLTLGPSLNKCIPFARGKYIGRQDGDDISHVNRLSHQVTFLENNPDVDLVGSFMNVFDENGIYGIRKMKKKPIGKDLMRGSIFAHATIVIKKEVLDALGGYSEDIRHKQVEDYELWYRFMENGFRGENINLPLYNVRENRNSYSRKSIKRRLSEIRVMIQGVQKLNLKPQYYFYILKPILTIFIPQVLLMKYHKRIARKNNI